MLDLSRSGVDRGYAVVSVVVLLYAVLSPASILNWAFLLLVLRGVIVFERFERHLRPDGTDKPATE
ncbi:hypothetical protein [Halostella salina]|uniref:hypothetical protein n=1 Tax=Halostella salina TaxID=1547897 RepID=UPI000EF7B84A|nr:hypothetical protein [Halostella salina]